MDEQCASACEEAVNVLKQLSGVTVVGVNTIGMNTYTEPLLILLPHTKIWYAVPSWIVNMGEDGGQGCLIKKVAAAFGCSPQLICSLLSARGR